MKRQVDRPGTYRGADGVLCVDLTYDHTLAAEAARDAARRAAARKKSKKSKPDRLVYITGPDGVRYIDLRADLIQVRKIRKKRKNHEQHSLTTTPKETTE